MRGLRYTRLILERLFFPLALKINLLQNKNGAGPTAGWLTRTAPAYCHAIKKIKIKMRAEQEPHPPMAARLKKIIKDLDVCRQNREQLLAYNVILNLATILLQ